MTTTFPAFERHFEKGLLAASGAFLSAAICMYWLGDPNQVTLNGREVGPREMSVEIERSALQLDAAMKRSVDGPGSSQAISEEFGWQFRRGVLHDGLTIPVRASLRTGALAFLSRRVSDETRSEDPNRIVALPRPLKITETTAMTGRSGVLRLSGETPEISWVTVAGCFDAKTQEQASKAAGFSPAMQKPYVAGVEAQRRELLAGGEWSEWTAVNPDSAKSTVPAPVFRKDGTMTNRRELADAWAFVKHRQPEITQPAFHQVVYGDPWREPFRAPDDATTPSPPAPDQADQPHSDTLTGSRFGPAAPNRSIQRAKAPAKPVPPKTQFIRGDALPVWFHDDTAVSGRTYEYRMRIRLWNRYLERGDALKNESDARAAYLTGEWSEPTPPMVAAPDSHFFVRGAKPDTSSAIVEVWKPHNGRWSHQNFEVRIGDTIGGVRWLSPVEGAPGADTASTRKSKAGSAAKKIAVDFSTNAIVLDLRMEKTRSRRSTGGDEGLRWNERATLVLTYLDPADGQVKERSQVIDAADPFRAALRSREGGPG
jgi:hypothetical protein